MRHITIAETLNEYDVEDEYYTIIEQDIPMYVFTVVDECMTMHGNTETTKYDLITPVSAVVENIGDHNEHFIDMLRTQSEIAAQQQMDAMKQIITPGDVDYV